MSDDHRNTESEIGGMNFNRVETVNLLKKWRAVDLVLAVFFFLLYFITSNLEPFQRQFYIGDLTISHPYAQHERVTFGELVFYGLVLPFIAISVAGVLLTKHENKAYVTYISLIGLCISVLSTNFITDIVKNCIGRHRPDFLERCEPRPDAPHNVLVYAAEVCTTKNSYRLKEGFRTTPSGHSSLSFSGLYYLSLWIMGQTRAATHSLGLWRFFLALIPSLGAAVIAISRTEDYRHHFIDVIIGALLGIAIAQGIYSKFFPSVFVDVSALPYASMVKSTTNGDSGNTRDSYSRLVENEV